MRNNNLNEVVQLKINDIIPNPYQPRSVFDENALLELADSIKSHGLIQPISVRYNSDKYELVVGERRLKASKLLNLKTIPAIIVDIDDKESAFVALIENLQREDLNFIEEANAMNSIMKNHNMSQKELSIKLGLNQSTISNKIRLLTFSDIVKSKISASSLTERHARALLKLKTESEQIHVINAINELDLNVKKTEDFINKILETNRKKKTFSKSFINYKIYVNTLKNAYKSIKDSGVDIEYSEDMDSEYVYINLKIPKK